MGFDVHDKNSAPEDSKPILEKAEETYGFLPNLLGVMAQAPALLEGYATLAGIFEKSSFTAAERQLIMLTISYENGCEYCVSAHSKLAAMREAPEQAIEAVRNGEKIDDDKLEALRRLTASLISNRGWPQDEELQAFVDAGYGKQQILELVLAAGFKTLSNYTNHLADTPLDDAFQETKWEAAA